MLHLPAFLLVTVFIFSASRIAAQPGCAPNPNGPTNGQTGVCPGTSILSWPAIVSATSYDVYFGTSAVPPFAANVAGTSFNAGSLTPGTYYWQVRPRNVSGAAAGCQVWSFVVGDATAPSITCPPSVTSNSCSTPVTYGAITATDNCAAPSITLVSGQASNTSFPVGVNTVIYRATDPSNNSSTCSFTVTVTDATAPTITCPPNVIANNPSNACSVTAVYGSITATDNCTAPTITLASGQASNTSFPVGVSTVVYRATDPSGNSATCSFTVTVKELIPPTITCPANVMVNSPSNECSATATYGSITATDNCTAPSITLASGQASNTVFPVGINTVVYRATDVSGNSSTCSFTVTVKDVTPPVAKCKSATLNLTSSGSVTLPASSVNNASTDNCSLSLSVTPSTLTCSNVGATIVTLRATDPSGNTSTCTASVSVKDVTPPTALCKTINVYLNDQGKVSITPAQVNNNSFDACGIATMTINQSQFNCSHTNGSPVLVALTLKDVNNNQSSCVAQVYVRDNIAPTAFCTDKTVTLNASGYAVVQTQPLAINSADNCSVTAYSPLTKTYTMANIGTNSLTITVKDWSNNSSTCVSQVTVLPFGSGLQAYPDDSGIVGQENHFNKSELDFSLFPNPATGASTVQFNLVEEQPCFIRLIDVNGREVLRQQTDGYTGEHAISLELGELMPGVYVVEIQSAGMSGRKKLILQE